MGRDCDQAQRGRNGDEGDRVRRLDAVEEAVQGAPQRPRNAGADADPGYGNRCALPDDHRQDPPRRSADGDPNADLPASLLGHGRDHAVEPDHGDGHTDSREDPEHGHRETDIHHLVVDQPG